MGDNKNHVRLREALAGPPTEKSKGPPVADGTLTATPDTPDSLELRTRGSILDGPSTSSFLEDQNGPQPHQLYGKYTWKLDNFKDLQKRELRSAVFTVGEFKWYVLVYPQGCDVCNHLSLFLCVADYDKLLPGWAHFAQFTISVVNKDQKKSKYSDTLHRFCKKEHDWGWKKFMEISKVLEGFATNDTLTINAQVQVIRDRQSAPFRCLDPQYRRELVRVYLTNVETICRKFCEDKQEWLSQLHGDKKFREYWGKLDASEKQRLQRDRGQDVLKGLVKKFFNEKEVTSTLVMDALFCGCKMVEEESRNMVQAHGKGDASKSGILVNAEKGTFGIVGNALTVLERTAQSEIPMLSEKVADTLSARSGQDGDDYGKETMHRDECRLAELGRRTVEVFIVANIFGELEKCYHEAEALALGNELIKEVENSKMQEGEKADKNREKRAMKKERRRQKKEAEEKEREAKEAARRVQEEEMQREELAQKEREAAERRKREEEARVEREAAQQEAAAAARMRRVPQTLARVEAQGEAKPLVAHPVRAASISDDGSDSSVRGRQQDASERQGQPGEDMKAGTSAPGESTVTASVADSEDAYSDAFNSSSSLQSEDEVASLPDQTEAAKKDATTEGLGASEVAELKSIISTLNEKLMTLQVDLDDRGEEVRRLEAVLQQSQALLAEKDAEIAILKVQAAAAFSGRVTPTTNLHIPSATSITGSTRISSSILDSAGIQLGSSSLKVQGTSTTTVGELASTMSDVSGDSRLSSPPLSPHGGAHSSRANGGAVSDEGDTLQLRQGSAQDPLQENGMAQHAAPGASTRLGRAPWNSGIGASNGAGAPPPAGPGAGRVRQARTGAGAAHPPAPNNGHGARTKHVISDSALKEASAAVERAMRPARTVSVPEPLAPTANQKASAAVSGPAVKSYASATQKSGKAVSGQPITKGLNGAAVPFIPSGLASAMSAPQPPSGPTPNGIVPPGAPSSANLAPSYRNAAAGAQRPPPPTSIPLVLRPGGNPAASLPSGSLRIAGPTSNGPSQHAGSQQGHSTSLESSADVAASVPPGSAPLPSMLGMNNAGQENGYRQPVFVGPPAGVAFQTPLQAKRAADSAQDTPGSGMDDFAHMGLITELLD